MWKQTIYIKFGFTDVSNLKLLAKQGFTIKSSNFHKIPLVNYWIFRKISYLCPRIKAFSKYRNEQKSARFHIVTYIIKANAQLLDFQSKSKLERVSIFNGIRILGLLKIGAYHTLFFIYSLLRLAEFNILLLPSRFLIRHIHSYQDAGGTGKEIGGNLLAKHPRGENHRGYRVEIHPVGSLYRAQF